MTSAGFDELMGRLDPPMVIVTTVGGDERSGCLVGFHSQAGMAPDAFAVWLSKANHTYRTATVAEVFAVHFLTHDQRDLALLFGTTTGDDIDKFTRCAWHAGPEGVPILDDCAHWLVGRKVAMLDTRADHVCVVLDPTDATTGGALRPLRLSDVDDLEPGHPAEEAP